MEGLVNIAITTQGIEARGLLRLLREEVPRLTGATHFGGDLHESGYHAIATRPSSSTTPDLASTVVIFELSSITMEQAARANFEINNDIKVCERLGVRLMT